MFYEFFLVVYINALMPPRKNPIQNIVKITNVLYPVALLTKISAMPNTTPETIEMNIIHSFLTLNPSFAIRM